MELNTVQLNDFVKNAKVLFLKGLDSIPTIARASGIFRTESIPNHNGNTKEYSEIDLELYAKRKGEGDQASRAKVQQGYSKIATAQRIGLDIGITYEMRRWNKYPDVVSRLTNLGALAARRMELDLQHRITFGTATSYTNLDGETVTTTMGDTLALFSTAHTLRGSSATYRNRLANNPAFARGSLEGMEKLVVEETLNQFGEKVTMPFDILWSTDDPNTVNTIREYLRSTAAPTQNNSGVVNVYQGKYRHVVLPLVATDNAGNVDSTKNKYWGLVSSMMTSAYLGVLEEPRLKTPPADGNSGEEFPTDDWNFGTRAGYFIEIVSGQAFKFSSGDATP